MKLTDYILADYVNVDRKPVNYYSAYYESQKKGAVPHSPKLCLPGGGWRIEKLDEIPVTDGRL